MCGLAGIYHFKNFNPPSRELLIDMLRQMKHRGPDEFGIYRDQNVGLASARLSIIDLKSGTQPIHNQDKTKWIVFTGEVYNYRELKESLLKKGHVFYSKSDTEVVLHLYEEKGLSFVEDLNGQFVIAIWDKKEKKLIIVRDRYGVRPLFYTIQDGRLLFASEIKSIFADLSLPRKLNLQGLDQILTFWTTIGKTTVFENIHELPPGHCLIASENHIDVKRYWNVPFQKNKSLTKEESIEKIKQELIKSVQLRLRSDVPVGMYLSGGVDSSIIASILSTVIPRLDQGIKTFSIQFDDEHDESSFQKLFLRQYPLENSSVRVTSKDIGEIFPKVIWHAETALFRTAPAPLYMLSQLVKEQGIKVVLSGEGADEIFWGYDTFREQKVRLFWKKFPKSHMRPLLLKKIFPYISHFGDHHFHMIKKFYEKNLIQDHPFYSHLPRWHNNEALKLFYSEESKSHLAHDSAFQTLEDFLPKEYATYEPLEQNQYLEMTTLLKGYLLSSQGDRMLMANSIEGRYPFLDHHLLIESARIPSKYKIFGMKDKHILREAFKEKLPKAIYERSKFAYRAPDAKSFLGSFMPEYVMELLNPANVQKIGYFNAEMVQKLIQKLRSAHGIPTSYRDNMAIVVIISTHLLHELFIRRFSVAKESIPLTIDEDEGRFSWHTPLKQN